VNVQISYDASVGEGERGMLKPSEYRHMGKGGIYPNRHLTFYSG